MAETDILNPVQGYWDAIKGNPNPSYGWARKTSTTRKLAAPRLGRRYSRQLLNAGYAFSFNWVECNYSVVLRLKQFYEQFQNGYFTMIDWDGGGRHHVGNFTTEPNAIEVGNGKYTVQGLVFEEAAQARMLNYPNDFDNASHNIYTLDDYLDPLVATSGSWISQLDPVFGAGLTGTMLFNTVTVLDSHFVASTTTGGLKVFLNGSGATPTGSVQFFVNGAAIDAGYPLIVSPPQSSLEDTFALTTPTPASYTVEAMYSGDANYQPSTATMVVPIAGGTVWNNTSSITVPLSGAAAVVDNNPTHYEALNPTPVAGDFAQIEYVGWGFKMQFRTDPKLGLCDIYVDGVIFVSGLDLSAGTAAAATVGAVTTKAVAGGSVVHIDMPLDKHRVKVVARNAAGAASTANGVIFPMITVLH